MRYSQLIGRCALVCLVLATLPLRAEAPAPFARPEALSGLWYEPARAGDGFNVLVAGSGTVVTWFGYDRDGTRLWLVTETYAGGFAPGVAANLVVYRGSGGTFGAPTPGVEPWGTLSLRFDGCTSGEFTLAGVDGTKVSRVVLLAGVKNAGACDAPAASGDYLAFGAPQRVTIRGYDGEAMEPFIARDGRYLLFNDSNAAPDTNLYYAQRVDDLTFEFRGPVAGANSPVLDAVPSLDRAGNLFFISTRSYLSDLSTIYRARFADGAASGVAVLGGLTEGIPGHLNFDAEIDDAGDTLYFVDGSYTQPPVPDTADLAIAVRDGAGFRRSADSARLLAAVNTPALEYAPSIAPGDLELFFTRYADGRLGIYRATRWRADAPFETPQRVHGIDGVVEAPSLSGDGRTLYFHRKDGAHYAIYCVAR